MSAPINLVIYKDGQAFNQKSLKEGEFCYIGRGANCNIVLTHPYISNQHATLIVKQGQLKLIDSSANGTFLNDKKVPKETETLVLTGSVISFADGKTFSIKLKEFDKANVGIASNSSKKLLKKRLTIPAVDSSSHKKPSASAFTSASPGPSVASAIKIRKKIRIGASNDKNVRDILDQKGSVTIGRDTSCDVVLSSLAVSRVHATITKRGQNISITDSSKNGTFVNGFRLKEEKKIDEASIIKIGPFTLSIAGEAKDDRESGVPAIVAENIQKQFDNGYIGVKELNLNIPSRQFIALMGPSGCGKTTLLKCLNGDGLASSGKVKIQGLELNSANYKLLKKNMGYVPQEDIIHRSLTVNDTMYYAAKLRLSEDTSEEEIQERIAVVLKDLNIDDPKIRSTLVSEISGGQRKRVSIAVELLVEPSLLFLDEPTSPLDPETIDDFLNCIRSLTQKGTTVIMVTHKPSDLAYVDQVLFMGVKGYINYFGSPQDIYRYFNLPAQNMVKVYSLLSMEANAKKWYDTIRGQRSSNQQVATTDLSAPTVPSENFLKQYYWLCRRYFQIKWNDKWNILLLVAQPVIIAFLLTFIFSSLQPGVMFLLAISAVWFGVSNAAKEIVGESTIYRRERMFNLSIWTYLLSKLSILSLIALLQVFLFIGIIYWKYSWNTGQPVVFRSFLVHAGFMFYLSISATLLGLLLSAMFDNTEKVMTFVPIALIPQIMLAGVVAKVDTPLKESLSYFTLGRWGTEVFCRIQDQATKEATFELWEKESSSDEQENVFLKLEDIDRDSSGIYFKKYNKEEVLASVMVLKPEVKITPTGMEFTGNNVEEPTEALSAVGFYEEEKEGEDSNQLAFFNSLSLNYLIISILNLGVFAGLFFLLKNKDDI